MISSTQAQVQTVGGRTKPPWGISLALVGIAVGLIGLLIGCNPGDIAELVLGAETEIERPETEREWYEVWKPVTDEIDYKKKQAINVLDYKKKQGTVFIVGVVMSTLGGIAFLLGVVMVFVQNVKRK